MSTRSIYHEGMRQLQDQRETRALADREAEIILRAAFTDEDRDFIQQCPMFFLATADAEGRPDCSYKGGMPGFVRVEGESTLAIPDYDGNGMYRSWGNVMVNPHVGLLFLRFDEPRRLRVNGTATVDEQDPLIGEFPGAVFIIRVAATHIFPNCPRYIHRLTLTQYSDYAPRAGHVPPTPAWKKFDEFRDVLPARDREERSE